MGIVGGKGSGPRESCWLAGSTHFCATDWERLSSSGLRRKALSRTAEKERAMVLRFAINRLVGVRID